MEGIGFVHCSRADQRRDFRGWGPGLAGVRVLAILFLSALWVWSAPAARGAEVPPGGVVYRDGDQAMYHDFRTGREMPLTEDLDIDDLDRVAASRDGGLLVWFADERLWGRRMPDGRPFPFPANPRHGGGPQLEAEGDVTALSPSPDGRFVAFEVHRSVGAYLPDARWVELLPTRRTLKVYGRSVKVGRSYFPSPHVRVRRGSQRDLRSQSVVTAASPAWSSDGPKLAFAERIGKWKKRAVQRDEEDGLLKQKWVGYWGRWGPITTIDCSLREGKPSRRRGREIDVSLVHCEALAWKPDGTLTYATDDEVFSVDGQKLADDVRCTDLCWATDEVLLFRGKDRNLHAWADGEDERILTNIPEGFSYCIRSPLSKQGAGKATDSGRRRVPGGSRFQIGPMALRWHPVRERKGQPREVSMRAVWIDTNALPARPVWAALAEVEDLHDIRTPHSYNYMPLLPNHVDPATGEQVVKDGLVKVPLGRTLLLRSADSYAAIRPFQVGRVQQGSRRELALQWRYWPRQRDR